MILLHKTGAFGSEHLIAMPDQSKIKNSIAYSKVKTPPRKVWVISKGTYTDWNLNRIWQEAETKTVTEYKVSDLGRYLLSPKPIQISKKLIGCEIHFRPPFDNIKSKIRRILPSKLHGLIRDQVMAPEVLMSNSVTGKTPMKDKHLESHLNEIAGMLRPYDPVIKRLSKIDPHKIADVIGTCLDIGGNLSYLNIQGSIDEKIGYIHDFLFKDVGVILDKAYISDGLFEMKGFDFESYDSEKSYTLIKFMADQKLRACVLDRDNTVDFWLEDLQLIHYLQLLDQLIVMNPNLNKSFNLCTAGKAEPLKLFFNKQLEVDYTGANLPPVYRRVFEMYSIEPNKKDIVKRVLNSSQLGVTFNYVPQSGLSEEKLFVNFSVMHNLKALEPIKDDLPQVYMEINKKASFTEAGKFYLLDSFRGYKDE